MEEITALKTPYTKEGKRNSRMDEKKSRSFLGFIKIIFLMYLLEGDGKVSSTNSSHAQ